MKIFAQISARTAIAVMAAALAACGGGHDDRNATPAPTASNPAPTPTPAVAAAPAVKLLSSKAEYVTGGNVLVDVSVPAATAAGALKVTLNGTDVTPSFKPSASDATHWQAVVTGLTNGPNTLVAGLGGPTTATNLTNYPVTGPVFSGPWQTPFVCQTQNFILPDGSKLGPAQDANCSIPTQVNYVYASSAGGALKAMTDLKTLPADVTKTTTVDGKIVPFIVRVETGTVDRGIYQSAVLHDPTTEAAPTPLAPPAAWNRRLIAIEGFGCPGGWYTQGAAEGNLSIAGFDFSLLNLKRLGEGYAMFANTLQHASNNCNAVLESEAAVMTKETVIKRFGAPAFTVSAGCSGGSYGSAQPADRIPDLFDGILISCTFPDPLSIAFSGSDGHLITNYITRNPGVLTDAQIAAVTGYKSRKAFEDAANQAGRTDPISGRVDYPGYVAGTFDPLVPQALRYDPVTNPTGARATVYDASRNMYGIDKATGFALRPYDNVGVQYGLAALNAGAITTSQFLDINEKAGGYDQNANYTAARSTGDTGAMTRAQQAGLQTGGNGGLASIPVFDVSGIYNDDTGYHYQWFHFALRERLKKANGDTSNHVMWRGNPVPADTAWNAFIKWVAAYKADTSSATQRLKVVNNKPAEAVDGCWSAPTTFVAEPQTLSSTPNSTCNTLFPSWTAPRIVAGGPIAADIMKCTLKPIAASDYKVALTASELARLQAVFPAGVCDWTKPGVAQTGVVPYGSFGPSPVNLLFDITKI